MMQRNVEGTYFNVMRNGHYHERIFLDNDIGAEWRIFNRASSFWKMVERDSTLHRELEAEFALWFPHKTQGDPIAESIRYLADSIREAFHKTTEEES